jgi:multiple sugar transport system substrate-binding protein
MAIKDLIRGADPKRSVPGALSVDWSLLGDLFVTGQVAMCYAWPDLGPFSLDPNRSKIIDKAGFAQVPGSEKVWDLEKNQWVNWDGVHKASVLAWGKGAMITKTCKNPEAAYDLIHYMVTGDLAIEEAINADDGLDPYRNQQFESQEVLDAYSSISTYIPALRDNISNGVPDLKIPQTVAYFDVIELWVDKAKRGEITPEEALERAEKDMERVTDSAGRVKQKVYYRQSLGLTD